ncbi:endospore germination permease [Paenibacillus sp. LHD-117]|uniref:GerAB/ArcD/ProY family transporter n=1 Tax=Paenibacillus sp. LHD-117 TaxID=3071412 RepID=UPI0027DECFB6|nr:endospore germination permease [Paenibacillus sp. LHD-117]MDQ6422431.1 endospore germination permease [Paenibacillus sp. LHD-117]
MTGTAKQPWRIQVSNGMFIAMIVNLIYVKAIGVTQGVVARIVGQDMWIVMLVGTLQGVAMMYVTYLVVRRTPGRDFMEAAELMLGRWFGKLVALLVFVLFFAGFGPIMITFVYHIHEYFLPEMPISLIIFASLIVGAIGCYYGLEVMARIALAGLFFIFLLNVMIVIGSTDEFDILNLLPVLEDGFPRALGASIHFDADWALATMLAALVMPLVKDHPRSGGKVGALGILLSGLLIIIWSILEAAVLSAEVTSQYTLSCMKLAHNAHIGHFLQRYEMVMIALYSLPILFEIMFSLYGCSVSMAKIFGIGSHKPTIVPVGLAMGAFAYWIVEDHFRAIEYLEQVWPFIALPIAVGLPLLLLTLGTLLKGRLRSHGKLPQTPDQPSGEG